MSNPQWYEQFNTKVDVGEAIGVSNLTTQVAFRARGSRTISGNKNCCHLFKFDS